MNYEAQVESLALAVCELVKGNVADSHCYRNLIDNIYAFRINAVNKTGKWDSKAIKRSKECFWSTKALNGNGEGLEKEHVVPLAEIVNILLAKPRVSVVGNASALKRATSVADVYNVIDTYCVCCMVDKTEHSSLNKEHQRVMPDEFWDPSNHLYYLNKWARYIKLGINYQKIP